MGLGKFLEPVPQPSPLADRPLLILHMDEGSPGYAAYWYCAYHLQLRLFLVRDVFHREWNDSMNAIKQAGLWWIILLRSVTFNLCYGPWEGSAWFEKVVVGALELFEQEQVTNPLYSALYGKICGDLVE